MGNDKDTVKETSKNGREKNGNFAIGNKLATGRPKGTLSPFTLIKREMAEIWQQEMGQEEFRKMFKEDFRAALRNIIAILPKELDLKGEGIAPQINVTFGKHRDNRRRF